MDRFSQGWFQAQGAIGGKKRAARQTKAQRVAQARRAAQARWGKAPKKGGRS